jgi:hypothetical protein
MLDAADAPLEVERHQHDVGEFEIGLFRVTGASVLSGASPMNGR